MHEELINVEVNKIEHENIQRKKINFCKPLFITKESNTISLVAWLWSELLFVLKKYKNYMT